MLNFPLETKICGSPRDDCHRFATCFDTAPGEYKCVCREGYVGDGKECKGKRARLNGHYYPGISQL